MNPEDIDRLATRLFSAIEDGDLEGVEELYAPDVTVWHNVTGETQNRQENLRLLRTLTQRVQELRYDVVDRRCFPGGFVQRHVARGMLGWGAVVETPVCFVAEVADGRFTAIYHYLDSAAVGPVFEDRVELMDPRLLEEFD
jgi:ketosteroid isomerase-like protein